MKTRTFPIALAALSVLLALGYGAKGASLSATAQVESMWLFPTPIRWIGTHEPPEEESAEVLAATKPFATSRAKNSIDELESFLRVHPQSQWAPSLHVDLAGYYCGEGRYSLALEHWEKAWSMAKSGKDSRSQRVAAQAVSGWTRLLASLGEKEKVGALLQEVDDLHLPLHSYSTVVEGTRGGLAMMCARPGDSFRCGSYALGYVARELGAEKKAVERLFQVDSPDGGFSVSQLVALARSNGIPVEAVRRPAGAEVVVPSVVHWKLNHYAAIVAREGNRYRVEDPTFRGHVFMTADTIDSEASGAFLVPKGKAPPSWQPLDQMAMATTYGKGGPNDMDDDYDSGPDGCDQPDGTGSDCSPPPRANDGPGGDSNSNSPPCDCGMPRWNISEPYETMWLTDVPLFYRVSSGKWMKLQLRYKHRGIDRGPNIGSFGPKWECNWLNFLVSSSNAPDVYTNYQAGGGISTLKTNGTPEYKSGVRLQVQNQMTGQALMMNMKHSIDVANTKANLQGAGYPYSYLFLDLIQDAFNRSEHFYYDTNSSMVRLTNVFDLDGRTNRITYGNTNFPNLITSVIDPYGSSAQFNYDTNGLLTNIVDMAGMKTIFQYDGNDNITEMITPYGTNSFQYLASTNTSDGMRNRGVLVTEASGDQQSYTYQDQCTNSSGQMPVAGDSNGDHRLSYHWNRAQYAAISPQGKTNIFAMLDADYKLAEMKHWLHGLGMADPSTFWVSDTMDSSADAVDPISSSGKHFPVHGYQWMGEQPPYIGDPANGGMKRVTSMFLNGNQTMAITRTSLGRPLVTTYYNNYTLSGSYSNSYDPSGYFLETVLGPHGELVRGYGYDPIVTNLLTSVTNAAGDVVRYSYDTNTMRITSITFPSGLVQSNLYYSSGPSQGFLRTQIEYQNGIALRTNSFAYTNGNLLAQTNELGLVKTFTYDGLNRLVSTAYPDGTTTSNIYNNLDLAGTKDRLNQWSYFGYNSVQQLVAQTNAAGQVTQYAYCGCGSPTLITNWNGSRQLYTSLAYDPPGRLTNVIYPDGYQVGYTYDNTGSPATITDSGGRQLTLTFYQIGATFKLATASLGGQSILQQTFDDYGRLTNSMDRNFVMTTESYDLLDRLISRQISDRSFSISNGIETFAYNATGMTNYTDSLGHKTAFVRDPAGRVLYQTNANNEVLAFTYNPSDELLTLTDGNTNTTKWNYDQYGRVTNKVDAANNVLFVYQYDPLDRLTNRWSAAKSNAVYKYDAVGNLTNVVYPVSSNLVFQYDGLNRLINMADGVGNTAFGWTDGDQLASEQGPWRDDAVIYSYNNRLRSGLSLAAPNSSAWVQSYGYDNFVQLRTLTSPAGQFGYSYYNSVSEMIYQITEPLNGYIQNSYDGLARLTQGSQWAGGIIPDQQTYSYDLASQRTQAVFSVDNSGNYHYMNYSYDAIGQLKTAHGIDHANYGSGYVETPRLQEQFGYAYDKGWNLAFRTNNSLVQTFKVNNLNELTTNSWSGTLTVAGTTTERQAMSAGDYGVTNVTVGGTGLSSGAANLYFDGSWARAGAAPVNGANSYSATAQDQLGRSDTASVACTLTNGSFAYDLNGNLLGDGTRNFAYDDENELTSVWVTNAWRSDFVYDGLMRRRIRREYTWSSGTWLETNEVHYVYDGMLVIQERDANNLPVVTYTRGNDLSTSLQGAGGIGGLLARSDNHLMTIGDPNAHAFYHADGNGNITAMFNTLGIIVARYLYDPFGNTLSMSGPLADANVYRFSSKEVHASSGLVYYGYRFYDANLQRWENRDPRYESGFETLHRRKASSFRALQVRADERNLYAFVRNNSLNATDPLGLRDLCRIGNPLLGSGLNPVPYGTDLDEALEAAVAMGLAWLAPRALDDMSSFFDELSAESAAEAADAADAKVAALRDTLAKAETDAMAKQADLGEMLDQGKVGSDEFNSARQGLKEAADKAEGLAKQLKEAQIQARLRKAEAAAKSAACSR